jgi:hypothetical protein
MIDEAVGKLKALLAGRIPPRFDTEVLAPGSERQLAETLNRFIDFMDEVQRFIVPLSRGELHDARVQPGNLLASPFKELHSRLLHLTWQAAQVAKGDYAQRVDFMGDFSAAFNAMIVALDRNEKLLRRKIEELEGALSHIRTLEGILPICSACKRIRVEGGDSDRQDDWVPVESYIGKRTEARFSHGICPACAKRLYPGLELQRE